MSWKDLDFKKYKIEMKKIVLLFMAMIFLGGSLMAQSRAYGVKGGLTIGTQKEGNFEQDPLFSYHGALSMESVSEANSFRLFAQVGYHVKGSAWRNVQFSNFGNNNVSIVTRKFKYQNVGLILGFKNNFKETDAYSLYYLFGIRGDYTVGTNLNEYEEQNAFFGAPIYPFDEAVRKFNYGATLGAGFQFPFTEYVSGIIEVTISPDFSDQYRQGAFNGTVYQNGSPVARSFAERKIRNLVFEVSVGFRFLHKIEYVD
jgi:hypothetical protein